MKTKWVERTFISLLMGLVMVFAASVIASAEESAPQDFCKGGVPWIIRDQVTLTDPGCSSGIFVLDVENVRFHQVSFDEAELIRGGKDATYWFEPAPEATPTATLEPTVMPTDEPEATATAAPVVELKEVFLPMVRQAPEHSTAPSGFCSGGVGWIVPSGSIPVDPFCGMGRYAVDRMGTRTWGGWDEVVSLWDSSVSATIWFEKAALSCSLGQETLCVGG